MRTTTIRALKKGEYFRLADSDTAPVWVRDEYIHPAKRYSVHRFDDTNHERLLDGNRVVYVGFIF